MKISTKDGIAKVLVNESDCKCTVDYTLHMIGKQLRFLGDKFTETKDLKYKDLGLRYKDMAVRMFKRKQKLDTLIVK